MKFKTKLICLCFLLLMFLPRTVFAKEIYPAVLDVPYGPYQALISFVADYLMRTDPGINGIQTLRRYEITQGLHYAPSGRAAEDFGYMLTDLDGDGTDELIISYDVLPEQTWAWGTSVAEISHLFTLRDGQVIRVASGEDRSSYRLCADGQIMYLSVISAAQTLYVFSRLDQGNLEIVQSVYHNYDYTAKSEKYYLTTQPNEFLFFPEKLTSEVRTLSKSEAEKIINGCEPAEMDLIHFVR